MQTKTCISKNLHPRVVAHRGFSKACPENTLPAFGAAVALGVDEIELDIWPSADGELVVMHDPDLQRTTNCEGIVMNLPWSHIAKADAGVRWGDQWQSVHVPRLQDVWDVFAGKVVFNIHIKNPGKDGFVIQKLKHLAEQYGITQQIYVAGDEDVLKQLLHFAPDIDRCCLFGQKTWALVDNGIKYQCRRVQFHNAYCDIAHIQKAHDAGMTCNLFYADDPIVAEQFYKMGIDSILTNAPTVILPVARDL